MLQNDISKKVHDWVNKHSTSEIQEIFERFFSLIKDQENEASLFVHAESSKNNTERVSVISTLHGNPIAMLELIVESMARLTGPVLTALSQDLVKQEPTITLDALHSLANLAAIGFRQLALYNVIMILHKEGMVVLNDSNDFIFTGYAQGVNKQ